MTMINVRDMRAMTMDERVAVAAAVIFADARARGFTQMQVLGMFEIPDVVGDAQLAADYRRLGVELDVPMLRAYIIRMLSN